MQVWAELVRTDTTFIVFNSGNVEVVGYRSRKKRILYVSDPIQPPMQEDPGYCELHTALYIAGFLDTKSRYEKQTSQELSRIGFGSKNSDFEGEKDCTATRGRGSTHTGQRSSSKGRGSLFSEAQNQGHEDGSRTPLLSNEVFDTVASTVMRHTDHQ